jgi:DhnA family fructose-bisphosphate aldolase class Ia
VNINVGKEIRMSDFIDSRDRHTLLLDLTTASSTGAPAGLEDIAGTLQRVNSLFDGIIVNPGQLEHHAQLLGGKLRAAPLVRVDWTNAYRDKDFCLPASGVSRILLSNGEDALRLGATAAVATLLLGFGEDLESENIQSISLLARECYRLSLPLVVDIRPIGGTVTQDNFAGSIKLGTSFMMEAGADVLVIPECDPDTVRLIGSWATVPVLIRCDHLPSPERAEELFSGGISGIVLSENILNASEMGDKIHSLLHCIHK